MKHEIYFPKITIAEKLLEGAIENQKQFEFVDLYVAIAEGRMATAVKLEKVFADGFMGRIVLDDGIGEALCYPMLPFIPITKELAVKIHKVELKVYKEKIS